MAKNKKHNKRITTGGSVGRTPTQTIVLQPTCRGGLDVSEYMTAIRKAELIDYPQRKKLIDLYKDVKTDSHLFAVLRKQKAAILSTPIQFLRDGEIDEQMQEHINSPWFNHFIEDLIDHEWEGVGGSLFQFYKDEKGWVKYDLIPREHVDPINRTILRNPTDLRGESWEEFSDLLYIGDPRQIGDLAVCAFWVILKRNNVSDWAELAEIFGRPIREGTYDAWDEKAREKLIEDIYGMGGAGVIIHPDGTKINLIQTGNVSGAGDMYSGLATYCNNEMSKAVNGNTLTTEAGDKGTQALGTVQQEGEVDITFFIKRQILDILNYEVCDIFAALGINTKGGKFAFVPPKKKDPKQQVDIVCKLINEAGLPVSDDYLYEEFGIPKPDDYDQIKEQAQATAAAIREGKKEDKTEDPDADGDESTEPKGKKSTSKKNEDRKFIDRLRSFLEKPRQRGGGFRLVVDELYRDAVNREVSSGFSFNADVLQRALRNIYYRKYDVSKDLDGHLLEEVNRIINSATDIGFSGSEADGEFMRQLRSNNEVFAAFKTHRMGRDIASRLIGEDGETKSFQQFKEDVQSITSHHVEHWLRTEYDTAIKRAQQAADMMQYRAEADVLPNLEWMPSTAMKPREEHMPFYHHIWAIDDPFWEQHKPGDQWGCQCDLAPTDKPVTDNSGLGGGPLTKPSAGLSGDPSRTGIIFSDNHPYFPNSCGNCVFNKGQLSLFTNKDKDCYQCAKVNRAIDKARKIAHQATVEELDAAYNEIREQIIAEFDTNSFIPIPVGDSHCTGKLQLNNPSLKRCLKSYKHTRSVQSKQCLLEAARHPEQLQHIRWAELGEGKNPDDPTDAKNIAKKVKRGVIGYNRYEFEFAGKTWVLGFEVVKKGYEQPYFVIQIK